MASKTKNKKQQGYEAEDLVSEYFQDQGFLLVEKNYTIKGGELDLIMKNPHTRMFVEVKEVTFIDDLFDHITQGKLQALKRSIAHFFTEHEQGDLEQQIVVVYVKENSIYHIYHHEQ